MLICLLSRGVISSPAGDSPLPTADRILAGIESENGRRHLQLKDYSVSRQYTMANFRFNKQASVAVLMNYRPAAGEHFTVLNRSGSDQLNSIIDRVLASEAEASAPVENDRRQITAANYRARLLGSEIAAGRSCFVLELTPRVKGRFLIAGKFWVDAGTYAVVRIEGQFAASMSMLVGTPRISEQFIEVNSFWMPTHVRSVTASFLLGPTELNILFTNYRFDRDSAAH